MDGDADCKSLLDQLGSYLDGEVAAVVALQMEAHVRACRPCRCLVESCRQTILVYRRQLPPELPAALHRKVMDRLGRANSTA